MLSRNKSLIYTQFDARKNKHTHLCRIWRCPNLVVVSVIIQTSVSTHLTPAFIWFSQSPSSSISSWLKPHLLPRCPQPPVFLPEVFQSAVLVPHPGNFLLIHLSWMTQFQNFFCCGWKGADLQSGRSAPFCPLWLSWLGCWWTELSEWREGCQMLRHHGCYPLSDDGFGRPWAQNPESPLPQLLWQFSPACTVLVVEESAEWVSSWSEGVPLSPPLVWTWREGDGEQKGRTPMMRVVAEREPK